MIWVVPFLDRYQRFNLMICWLSTGSIQYYSARAQLISTACACLHLPDVRFENNIPWLGHMHFCSVMKCEQDALAHVTTTFAPRIFSQQFTNYRCSVLLLPSISWKYISYIFSVPPNSSNLDSSPSPNASSRPPPHSTGSPHAPFW